MIIGCLHRLQFRSANSASILLQQGGHLQCPWVRCHVVGSFSGGAVLSHVGIPSIEANFGSHVVEVIEHLKD